MKPAQASSTAKVIAAATILLASEKRHAGCVAPGASDLCRAFLSGCAGDRLLAWSASSGFTRPLWRLLERMTLPGIIDHYWRRKRRIEERCRAAIIDGFDRVVIVGAGLDTLGLRLAREMSGLDVIETDHPATRDVKLAALAKQNVAIPANFKSMALDLTKEGLPVELSDQKPTLFVIEGVLMYLRANSVDRLFENIRVTPGTSRRVIFSFMRQWPNGGSGFRPHSRIIHFWLAVRGEPFIWTIDPGHLHAFLSARGFDLLETECAGGSDASLEGENLVVCSNQK